MHVDDLTCLWGEPSVDIVAYYLDKLVVWSSLPWFREFHVLRVCYLSLNLSVPLPLRNYVEATVSDTSQKKRPLRFFTQLHSTIPQTCKDILYGIFCFVLIAQQDICHSVHPIVFRMEKLFKLLFFLFHHFLLLFILNTTEHEESLPHRFKFFCKEIKNFYFRLQKYNILFR